MTATITYATPADLAALDARLKAVELLGARLTALELAVAALQVPVPPVVVPPVVVPPVPPSGLPDPTKLPAATKQLPNLPAYNALNVAGQAAGYAYTDPVTGVRVWKVTSPTVPVPNSGAGHDYSDGPHEVSRGWGPNGNTHTLLVGAPQGAAKYSLVDFTRGVGFANWRPLSPQPLRDLCFSFSNVEPRIAYLVIAGQLVRYNTATMQVENTGRFPLAVSALGWVQHDKADVWFVGLADATTAFAWNSATGQLLTHTETWLNEPRLERDGRYVVLTNTNSTFRLWDLTTNTFGPVQSDSVNFWLGHNANLRGHWVTTDVNASAPAALDRYSPSGGQIVKTRILPSSAGTAVHHSGAWVQADADLPGASLLKQWSFMDAWDDDPRYAASLWHRAIGAVRSDGSDARLVAHHYSSVQPPYWATPFAQPSPDGKVLIFNSNMLGAARYDLFLVELPLT